MKLSRSHIGPGPASHPWVVAKFGGTSVARAERWEHIRQITGAHLAAHRRVLVVCSAAAGVTNLLESIASAIDGGTEPGPLVAELRRVHQDLAASLGVADAVVSAALADAEAVIARSAAPLSPRARALVLAQGELLSTRLGATWLAGSGLDAAWMDARTLLRALPDGDRAERYLSARCAGALDEQARARVGGTGAAVVVTQGFIAADDDGDTVLLGRGGSDTSAAYLAAAIGAASLEIWTDVPGLFTADPRLVADARLLRRVSYAEAEAMGALGAKVLHPRTIEPARQCGIPIRLGWTEHPHIEGTRIVGARQPRGVKAVVARRNLALIAMWRPSSWQPVGFLAEVARRFQERGLSLDLVVSSASEIRATIDLAAFPSARADLAALLADLAPVCRPRLLSRVACVSAVGTAVSSAVLACPELSRLVAASGIHAISHAANGADVSFVVDEAAVDSLVPALHAALLGDGGADAEFGPRWTALTAPIAPPRARTGAAA